MTKIIKQTKEQIKNRNDNKDKKIKKMKPTNKIKTTKMYYDDKIHK